MKWYGLLGKTLKHSFSKTYFTQKFKSLGIEDCVYDNFELASIEELPELLRKNPSIKGLNVTIPYKEEVLKFLDKRNEIVDKINACNCIKIFDEKLIGFNTDVIGFKQSLEKSLDIHHNNALILGTGGSAKAVQYALRLLNINYQNVSRIKSKFSIRYEELDENILNQHKLIINTSPLGMFPNVDQAPPIPYQFLKPGHLLFDLIYNPDQTLFLKRGLEKGAKIANGAEMLVLQAEESWKIWNS